MLGAWGEDVEGRCGGGRSLAGVEVMGGADEDVAERKKVGGRGAVGAMGGRGVVERGE